MRQLRTDIPPFSEFEKAGEWAVRHAVEAGHYSLGRAASARSWLAWKEEGRQEVSDAFQAEQTSAASRAADAASRAADAADKANELARDANALARSADKTAKIAAAIAALALIASIALPFILRH